jgi:hypothetical protein
MQPFGGLDRLLKEATKKTKPACEKILPGIKPERRGIRISVESFLPGICITREKVQSGVPEGQMRT